jgi:hypothetical protein
MCCGQFFSVVFHGPHCEPTPTVAVCPGLRLQRLPEIRSTEGFTGALVNPSVLEEVK